MNINEMTLHERMRSDCYRFLSACFYQPQKGILIDEGLLNNLTASLQCVCPEAAAFSSEMEKNVLNYNDEELAVEYARLFVGPYEIKAAPYGSVYIDEGRRVMGDSTMEVIRIYEEEGLSRNSEFKDLPDHIAVELEFMSYLTFKRMKALENSDPESAQTYLNKQKSFHDKFLSIWIPRFCIKIQEGTTNGFFLSLAACLSAFIKSTG